MITRKRPVNGVLSQLAVIVMASNAMGMMNRTIMACLEVLVIVFSRTTWSGFAGVSFSATSLAMWPRIQAKGIKLMASLDTKRTVSKAVDDCLIQ